MVSLDTSKRGRFMRYQVAIYISNMEVVNRKFMRFKSAKEFILNYEAQCPKSMIAFIRDRYFGYGYKKVLDEENKYE